MLLPCAATAVRPEPPRRLELGLADFGQYRPAQVERLLRVAARLRLGAVRLTMEWSPGQTRLGPTQLATVAVARRFPRLTILYTLSFVRGRDAPTTPGARRAFVAWAQDLVRHGALEVEATNEPMQPLFWSTPDPAPEYAALLVELYGALHRERAGVTVVAGSLAVHHARAFMRELAHSLAGRRVADAVSLHYPESAWDFERRVALLRRCFGANLPVYVTEDGSRLDDDRAQAAQLAQRIGLAEREHAGMWILLQLQNRPDLMPWHTGLFGRDWRRQPAYAALARSETAIRAVRPAARTVAGNWGPP